MSTINPSDSPVTMPMVLAILTICGAMAGGFNYIATVSQRAEAAHARVDGHDVLFGEVTRRMDRQWTAVRDGQDRLEAALDKLRDKVDERLPPPRR